MEVYETLMSIKKSILNGIISYSEIAYLQAHKKEIITMDDIELAQWAGIPEEEWNK